MSEAKPRLVWVAEHDDDSDYLSVMERLDTQGVYEGVTVCRLHDEAAADLIADAGTVFNTTGLTPSQLVERVKELEGALRKISAIEDQMYGPDWQEIKEARGIADAALSKARPNTAEGEAGGKAPAGAANDRRDLLEDAAFLLRKYRKLCVEIGRGDSQHLDRIEAAAVAVRALYADPTPTAQPAIAGAAGWQDISTAPKDGTRFVAVGQNYGLYSETQHTCIAQWFRGCWMEVSDWNETSELTYLTLWMPLLPLPAPTAQAAPAAAKEPSP